MEEKAIAIMQDMLDIIKYADETGKTNISETWSEKFRGAVEVYEALFGGNVYNIQYKVVVEED